MNKKKQQKEYDIDKLSITKLKTILRTYKKLGYKFDLNQSIEELRDTLRTLIRCEALTYKQLQKVLGYYQKKSSCYHTYLTRNREYLKVALFKIECRFSEK